MKKKVFLVLLLFLTAFNVQAIEINEDMRLFAEDMSKKYGLNASDVLAKLEKAEYSAKGLELMDRQYERSTWGTYKKNMLTENRIKRGVIFSAENKSALELAYLQYGVRPEIITAILGVETNYGDYKLTHNAIDVLTTLGFHYPRRADYFKSELASLIVYADKNGIDPFTIKSSYAGAVGIPQFMPSNITKYGVDFGGDNRPDLVNSVVDSIGSVANYLSAFGWEKDKPIAVKLRGKGFEKFLNQGYDPKFTVKELRKAGVILSLGVDDEEKVNVIKLEGEKGDEYWAIFKNFRVIMRYNNSANYALVVTLLGIDIKTQSKKR